MKNEKEYENEKEPKKFGYIPNVKSNIVRQIILNEGKGYENISIIVEGNEEDDEKQDDKKE